MNSVRSSSEVASNLLRVGRAKRESQIARGVLGPRILGSSQNAAVTEFCILRPSGEKRGEIELAPPRNFSLRQRGRFRPESLSVP